MVLTVGNDDNGLSHALLLGKAMGRHVDCRSNIGALGSYHPRADVREEHLSRHVVTGDGQLHKGIAGKHDKTYLVVGEVVHQILYHHLRAIQTAGCHIFGQHRVADVQTDDCLYAGTFFVTDFRAQLRTGQHNNE